MTRLYYSASPEPLFKEALKLNKTSSGIHDYSGIICVNPSSLRAKLSARLFHKIISTTNYHERCYIPPDITTLSELSKRLYAMYGRGNLIEPSLKPIIISRLSNKGLGFSILISDLIHDIKQFHPGKNIIEIEKIILDTLDMFNVPELIKISIKDSLEIFKQYQDYLKDRGLADPDDALHLCPEYIKQYLTPSVTIIDNLDAPTKAELEIIKALIDKSEHSIISIPFTDEVTGYYLSFLKEHFDIDLTYYSKNSMPDFVYHPCDDVESEVDGIARHIKSLFLAEKIKDLNDVIVAFPALNKYKDIIKRTFHRYGIPFNIMRKRPLAKERPVIDLLCMIQSVIEDYPRLKFSQFLSSKYFKAIPRSLKNWIPILSIHSGIISGKKAWLNFLRTGNERIDIKDIIDSAPPVYESGSLFEETHSNSIMSIKDLGKDIQYVFEKLSPLEKIKTSSSISTFSTTLKNILQDLGFLDTTPADEDYRTLKEIRMYLLNCLDKLSSIDIKGDSLLRLQEFYEYLRHSLDNTYIETDTEGVTVTDIREASSVTFLKKIYLGGLTDSDLPGRGNIDYIIPDNVKRATELPDLDRNINLQRFFFEKILRYSEDVHLSYPVSEGEDKFLPSPFLYSGRAEKKNVPGIFSKEELLIMTGERPLREFLYEIKVNPNILNLGGILNVTDIDAYRKCPRRFFIERLLGLLPPTIKEYDLEARVLGDIIHGVMEKIIYEDLSDIEHINERAIAIVDEVTGQRNIDQFWRDIIKDTFLEILPDIVKLESNIRKEGFKPYLVEEKVTGEPIRGIRLKGKIDRVDKSDSAVAIIDYKTGSENLNCSGVLNGKEKLQLFLYAALLKTKGYSVDRVGIYSLKDIKIKWCPSKAKNKGDNVDIEELIKTSLQFLEEAVNGLRKGIFTAVPFEDNPYMCSNCHENPFCPYIQS